MSKFPSRRHVLCGAAAFLTACHAPSRPGAPPPAAGFQPLQPGQADKLVKALAEAPAHGFQPGAFATDDLASKLHTADAGLRGPAEQALLNRILAYAQALHGLSIPPSQKPKQWDIRPAPYDGAAELIQALGQGQLDSWLAALPPADPRYQSLRGAYDAYLKLVASGGWPQLSADEGPPDSAALLQRLAVEDASLGAASSDSPPQDDQLSGAVQRAQNRYGLHPTGVADAELVKALNIPAQARAAQIRANLERLRWLPREMPSTRIEVNTAAAEMDLWEDGAPALHMLAAAGKPGDETPMLMSQIGSIEFNPPWNVPKDIARKELLPKGQGYLSREDFVWKDGRLVQQPGPKCALGQVKFDFPNPFQVYLHDTPSRQAFTRSNRQVSHGCVRLEHAVDLAKRLLQGSSGWPPDRVDEVLASDDTRWVRLPEPMPVGLYYFTAFVQDGQVAFRDDAYGWDAALLRLLDAGASSSA
jgi:murein L,D-transpeptidase YcbB/YkuD